MSTIYDYVQYVRNQIRDNGAVQAFPDVIDNTLTTPAIVPNNSPELTQFVNDSAREYERYRPLRKPFTLNLQLGQTQYALPDDWISVDQPTFQAAISPQPAPDLSVYALPFIQVSQPMGSQASTMKFNWYDDSQLLVLSTAPLAAYSLQFDYYASHSIGTSGSSLPRQWEYVALLPACEKALMAIATDQAVKLQKYKIHNAVDVDNTKIAEHLIKLADGWRDEFRKQVILRPYGAQGAGEQDVNWW